MHYHDVGAQALRGLGQFMQLFPRIVSPGRLGDQKARRVHRIDRHLVVIAQINHVINVGGDRINAHHEFDAVVTEAGGQLKTATRALGVDRGRRQHDLARRDRDLLADLGWRRRIARGASEICVVTHPQNLAPRTGNATEPILVKSNRLLNFRYTTPFWLVDFLLSVPLGHPQFASERVGGKNGVMHVDHLVFAAGPDGLDAEVRRLGALLDAEFKDGGFHPRFGTRNNILPLSEGRYLEVVEVLDHPAADKAIYGQAVRARMELGGGWMGWVVRVDDLAPIEERLGRLSVEGSRHFPDGRLLEWKQIGIKGLMADPQLPYFLKWESTPDLLPSALKGDIGIQKVEIAGSRPRVEDWLGVQVGDSFDGIDFEFTAPNGHPGLDAVTFNVPGKGSVRI